MYRLTASGRIFASQLSGWRVYQEMAEVHQTPKLLNSMASFVNDSPPRIVPGLWENGSPYHASFQYFHWGLHSLPEKKQGNPKLPTSNQPT